MLDFNNPAPYLVGVLILLLAYFLKDAHTTIKSGLAQKATQEALDRATSEWREDIRDDRERHTREMLRLENHYEQKFVGGFTDLHDQIKELKSNLQDRMDLILKLLERRAP